MTAPDNELRAFCRQTGAKAIVGSTRPIDRLESASFDRLLVPRRLDMSARKPVFTRALYMALCRDRTNNSSKTFVVVSLRRRKSSTAAGFTVLTGGDDGATQTCAFTSLKVG